MKQYLARLGVMRSLIWLGGGLLALFVLMILIGWVWVVRLPPAPTVLPDPQILMPATIFVEKTEFDPLQFKSISQPINKAELMGDQPLNDELAADVTEVFSLSSRPLFWASRLPQAEGDDVSIPEDDSRPKKDEFDKVKLVGVYDAGDGSGVIAEVKGERQRVRLKQALEGWVLDSLHADGAVFIQGGKQKKLQLEHANLAKYTATASKKVGSDKAITQDDTSADR